MPTWFIVISATAAVLLAILLVWELVADICRSISDALWYDRIRDESDRDLLRAALRKMDAEKPWTAA